jgi:hypothetical protein
MSREVEKLEEEVSEKDKENQMLVVYDDELYTEEDLRNQIMEDAFGDNLT